MKRIRKKLLSGILVLLLLVGLVPIDALASEKTIVKVGFYPSAGFQDVTDDGEFSGSCVELLTRLRRYCNISFKYIKLLGDSRQIRAALDNGTVDMLVGIRRTPDREETFDFSKPLWNLEVELSVNADNKKIISGNYATYNGMVIGAWDGDGSIDLIENFAKSRGFTYTLKQYDSLEKLNIALAKGEIDAILRNNMNVVSNTITLDVMQVEPTYIAVKKGNAELLNKINTALNELDKTEEGWRMEVIYSKAWEKSDIGFTDAENKIIEDYTTGGKVLRVSSNIDKEPYSYNVDGQLTGILPEIFKEAIKSTGMNYVFVTAKSREDYREMVENGSIDIALDIRNSRYSNGKMPNVITTQEYITVGIAELSRKNFDGNIKKVAVIDNMGYTGIPALEDDSIEKKVYSSRSEIIQAVAKGDCDVAYTTLYAAVEAINRYGNKGLTYKTIIDSAYTYSMGVCECADNELAGVLVKCLNRVSESEKRRIVNSFILADSKLSAKEFFGMHPEYLVYASIFVVASLLVIIGAVWHSRLSKYNAALELENEKNKVLEQELRMTTELERAQRNYNEGLQNAKALAEEASAAKSRFLFNISHDIRTPMNAIIGFTKKARDNVYDPKIVDECLGKVEESNEYLLSLVNDVLDLARIESDKMHLELSIVNIASKAGNITTLLEHMIKAKNITLVEDYSELGEPWVWMDELRLKQILNNILTNAIKYTNPNGTIKFSIQQKESPTEGYGIFIYTVEDNGIGMTEEFLNHIFEIFSRADMSLINKTEGTGLGMAIVKSLVTLMGGDIDIQSKLGEGTKVTITLNLKYASQEEIDSISFASKEEQKKYYFEDRRVLLVEDNELNRELARDILAGSGFKIEEAVNGMEALEKVKRSTPGYYDLILMDIQMPIMNGYAATKAIRELEDKRLANIPIIAMTANAFEEDKKAAIEAGMNAHSSKPINVLELMETMDLLINKNNSQ